MWGGIRHTIRSSITFIMRLPITPLTAMPTMPRIELATVLTMRPITQRITRIPIRMGTPAIIVDRPGPLIATVCC